MQYAIIENNIIVNVAEADAPLAENWEPLQDGAGIGWSRLAPDTPWAAVNLPSGPTQDELVADSIEALWQAADKYVTDFISGVAIGILTIGVIQGKPKALAVTAWSNAVWSDYYARKALVEGGAVPNLDFSTHGPIPHTIPELQDEIGL